MVEDWIELQYFSVGKRKIRLHFIFYVKKIVAILAVNIACKEKKSTEFGLPVQCYYARVI